ncbi:hypothetical protein [Falsihalocynthiibacter arcticus]|uniref:Uncharacterized protein n=1 Tax=Falsihalocynthiibacter arcticus TaxID=1579316 RepID=A0A126V1F3_9RHOB|nr:hypothetical protein [Falsihalocynthiibacter arcticus]AML51529.1 hypothetical protein RC74_09895 [Falsihalocynthiibacter arcticus]
MATNIEQKAIGLLNAFENAGKSVSRVMIEGAKLKSFSTEKSKTMNLKGLICAMAKRELPKHVYLQKNGLYFQRRGCPSKKFEKQFGTPEFWKEYADILGGKQASPRVIPRSFSALISDYRKSPRYKNLKPRTSLDYDKYLDFFGSIMGEASPTNLKRKDVIRLRDSNAEKAYFANYSLRVLRVPHGTLR